MKMIARRSLNAFPNFNMTLIPSAIYLVTAYCRHVIFSHIFIYSFWFSTQTTQHTARIKQSTVSTFLAGDELFSVSHFVKVHHKFPSW